MYQPVSALVPAVSEPPEGLQTVRRAGPAGPGADDPTASGVQPAEVGAGPRSQVSNQDVVRFNIKGGNNITCLMLV